MPSKDSAELQEAKKRRDAGEPLTPDDKRLLEQAKFEEQMTAYITKRIGWIKKALIAGGAVIAATVGYQFFTTRSVAQAAADARLDARVADVESQCGKSEARPMTYVPSSP